MALLAVLRLLSQRGASETTKVLFFFASSVHILMPSNTSVFRWFAFLDFNATTATGLCLAPLSVYEQLSAELLLPLFLFVQLGCMYGLHAMWSRVRQQNVSGTLLRISYQRTAIALLLFQYSSL